MKKLNSINAILTLTLLSLWPNFSWAMDPLKSTDPALTVTTAALLAAGQLTAAFVRNAFNRGEDLPTPVVTPVLEEIKNEDPQEEPFERRYLNGIDIDSPFIDVEVLPTTDNNCGLFGIYGRTDVTREEVIEELMTHADATTPIARHIRGLMAVEILAYLIDGGNIETLAQAAESALARTTLINLLGNFFANYNTTPTDITRDRLLAMLASSRVFKSYTRHVMGVRIGSSDNDPYPMLGITLGNQAHTGAAGALAAIAAMRGASLHIYHRNAAGNIEQVAAYIHDRHLTPQLTDGTVDLLQTTADPINNPQVLNHFNLLKRYKSKMTTPSHNKDSMAYTGSSGMWARGSMQLPFYISSTPEVERWIAKLGFPVAEGSSSLKIKELRSNAFAIMDCDGNIYNQGQTNEQYKDAVQQEKQLKKGCGKGASAISDGFNYPTFHTNCEHISQIWSFMINKQIELIKAIGQREAKVLQSLKKDSYYGLKKVSKNGKKLYNNIADFFIESTSNDHDVFLEDLNVMRSMTPSLRNLQFIILRMDKALRLTTEELAANFSPKCIQNILSKQLSGTTYADSTPLSKCLTHFLTKVKVCYQHDIILLDYFLDQLIDLCRIHGYEPLVPHYNPGAWGEQERELMQVLVLIASQETIEQQVLKDKKDASTTEITLEEEHEDAVNVENNTTIEAHLRDDNSCIFLSHDEATEDAYDVEHYSALFEAFCEDMRQKKLRQSQLKPVLSRASVYATITEIGVLTPEERDLFQVYLRDYANVNTWEAYKHFENAAHLALTLTEIDELAKAVAGHLNDFLKARLHLNESRIFSDEAIRVFIKSFLNDHAKTFHCFHPGKGKKVPSAWMQFRHAPWIAHGIMPVKNENRSNHVAHMNYQEGLVRRVRQ